METRKIKIEEFVWQLTERVHESCLCQCKTGWNHISGSSQSLFSFTTFFFFLSIHFLRRKTRQLLPCSERGTNCLWFPLGIKYRLVLFSFMSYRSSTQFRSIWKEQKKVYGSLSECWAPCLPNKPCKNKNNQFCIMPQPLPCFCQSVCFCTYRQTWTKLFFFV